MPSSRKPEPFFWLNAFLLGFGPTLLLCASLVASFRRPDDRPWTTIAWYIPATVVAGLNFYLSFVGPVLHKLRHGNPGRWPSGLPMIGTLLIAIAAILSFGNVFSAFLGLLLLMLDTGGMPWFLWIMWRERTRSKL